MRYGHEDAGDGVGAMYTRDHRQMANTKRDHMLGFEDVPAVFASEYY
jgi:hypothetical protein